MSLKVGHQLSENNTLKRAVVSCIHFIPDSVVRLSSASCCFVYSLRDSAVRLSVMDWETHAQTLLKIKLQTKLLSRFGQNQKKKKSVINLYHRKILKNKRPSIELWLRLHNTK